MPHSTAALSAGSASTIAAISSGCAEHHGEVDAHAHRDEEQPEQQALERLDVGLELAPVFALGQQHAGQKGAERHRQADRLHQRGGGHHQQQGRGGEDLGRLAARDPAQRGAQQQPAAEHDGGDDARSPWRAQPAAAAAAAAPATASSGSRARIGIAATSCSSATLRTLWPDVVPIRLRSPSTAEADRGGRQRRGRARRRAPGASRCREHRDAAASAAAEPNSCTLPQPKIGLRSAHSRRGSSSSPTRNSISTTPNSAKCRMSCGSVTSFRPQGPITMPAAR